MGAVVAVLLLLLLLLLLVCLWALTEGARALQVQRGPLPV